MLRMPLENDVDLRTIIEQFRNHRNLLQVGRRALESIHRARGAGPLGGVMAGVSVLDSVVESLYPSDGVFDRLRGLGLEPLGGEAFRLVANHVDTTHAVRISSPYSNRCSGYLFPGGRMAVYIDEGRITLWAHPDDGSVAVREAVDVIWGKSREYLVSYCGGLAAEVTGSGSLQLRASTSDPVFIGNPGPSWYADRLRSMGGNRCLVLRGRSGCGKSALARLIANDLAGGKGRVLRVSSRVLLNLGTSILTDLASSLNPDCVLIDDLEFNEATQALNLAILESLKSSGINVIITMMTQDANRVPAPGDFYFEGMRPGRVDEIHLVRAPDANVRSDIIDYYSGSAWPNWIVTELSEALDGQTGAFIKELVSRITAFGLEHRDRELRFLLQQAPKPQDS